MEQTGKPRFWRKTAVPVAQANLACYFSNNLYKRGMNYHAMHPSHSQCAYECSEVLAQSSFKLLQ